MYFFRLFLDLGWPIWCHFFILICPCPDPIWEHFTTTPAWLTWVSKNQSYVSQVLKEISKGNLFWYLQFSKKTDIVEASGTLGTFWRHCGHWAEITDIGKTW